MLISLVPTGLIKLQFPLKIKLLLHLMFSFFFYYWYPLHLVLNRLLWFQNALLSHGGQISRENAPSRAIGNLKIPYLWLVRLVVPSLTVELYSQVGHQNSWKLIGLPLPCHIGHLILYEWTSIPRNYHFWHKFFWYKQNFISLTKFRLQRRF